MALSSKYNPREVEDKWYQQWLDRKFFHSEPHPDKEAYTIVIDEPKDEFVDLFKELNSYDENLSLIENYRDIQLQLFNERMRVNTQSSPRSLKINGLDEI